MNRKLIEGASGVTPLVTNGNRDIGLAQVRRTPTLKAYFAILEFVKKAAN